MGTVFRRAQPLATDALMDILSLGLLFHVVLGRRSDLRSCPTGGGHVAERALVNNGPIECFQLASLMAQCASLPVGITVLCLGPTLQAVSVNRFTAAGSHC